MGGPLRLPPGIARVPSKLYPGLLLLIRTGWIGYNITAKIHSQCSFIGKAFVSCSIYAYMILWCSDKLLSSNILGLEQDDVSYPLHRHSWFIDFKSMFCVVEENMNVCKSEPDIFRSKHESWIAQPTQCRNVRPEGLSPAVLLEVNGTVTAARMSRNTLNQETEEIRESVFQR